MSPSDRFRLSPAHLDLLVACLASDDDRAARAYARWRPTAQLNDLDSGTHRLLPLLLRRLDGSGEISDEDTSRLRASTRFAWLRAELHLAAARSAADLLRTASIPTMAIKGLAVLHHTGRSLSTRPMDDADLLVPFDRAAEALRHLVSHGFTTWTRPDDEHSLRPLLAHSHAVAVEDARRAQVDLHWHAVATSLHPEADADVWARAQDSPGPADRVADPESTVLHVLAHAGRFATTPSVAWVADLVDLVRTRALLDWEHVLDQARAHRLGPQVNDALDLVQSLDVTSIPPRRVRGSLLDHLGNRPRTRPTGRVEETARALVEHASRTTAPGARADPAGFLTERWGLTPGQRIVGHLGPALLRRPWRDRPRGRHPGLERYELGTAVDLTVGGSGLAALGPGWSFPEPHGTWTLGREAVLGLQLAHLPTGPLLLRVQATPLLSPGRPERLVDVAVNGRHVARWRFVGTGWQSETRDVLLPPLSTRRADIRLVVHRPVSPQDLTIGTRSLPAGLSVSSLVLLPA